MFSPPRLAHLAQQSCHATHARTELPIAVTERARAVAPAPQNCADRTGPESGCRNRPADQRHAERNAALDGIRFVAVAAVMAFHFGVPGAGGGFLGVDLFFVLSGFLITSMLLR